VCSTLRSPSSAWHQATAVATRFPVISATCAALPAWR
jgi:hypothetical protein